MKTIILGLVMMSSASAFAGSFCAATCRTWGNGPTTINVSGCGDTIEAAYNAMLAQCSNTAKANSSREWTVITITSGSDDIGTFSLSQACVKN